jgi:hypothetical protein
MTYINHSPVGFEPKTTGVALAQSKKYMQEVHVSAPITCIGAPGRIRTYGLELRSLLLYPAELPGRVDV